MANVDLLFNCDSGEGYFLEVYQNSCNSISVSIDFKDDGDPVFVMLDVPTAIKFAKTLRTEINKAKEVQNG